MYRSTLPLAALMLSACIDPFGIFRQDKDDYDDDGDDKPYLDTDDDRRGECDAELRDCLRHGGAPDRCNDQFEECLQGGDSADTDVDHTDADDTDPIDTGLGPAGRCDAVYDRCVDLGLPEPYCADERDNCLSIYVPSGCDALEISCLELGLDVEYCDNLAANCEASTDTDVVTPDTDADTDAP